MSCRTVLTIKDRGYFEYMRSNFIDEDGAYKIRKLKGLYNSSPIQILMIKVSAQMRIVSQFYMIKFVPIGISAFGSSKCIDFAYF